MINVSKHVGGFVGKDTLLGMENASGERVSPEVEVSVVSGKPTLTKTDKNASVSILPDGLKFQIGGFIDIRSEALMAIEKAVEMDTMLCLRFEKVRKKTVDTETPISELTVDMNVARENIVKLCTGVYNPLKKEWLLTREARSNPSDDPDNITNALGSLHFNSDDFTSMPQAPQKQRTFSNADAPANNLITYYYMLFELNKKEDIGLSKEVLFKYSKFLQKVANSAQMKAFDLEEANEGDYSHTKIRQQLFKYFEIVNPLNKEILTDQAKFKEWLQGFIVHAVEVSKWAHQ